MENTMEHETEAWLYSDPCIQIISTLCPKVCKYYLHWAIWIPRVHPESQAVLDESVVDAGFFGVA